MFSFIVRPRKRAIRYKTHKAFISKTLVERGLEHVTKKKRKLIPQKVFGVQSSCKCSKGKKKKLNCNEKITAARQKQIFESYYEEMSWTQKSLFIRSSVKRQPVKTKKSNAYALVDLKRRDFNHKYTLIDHDGVENEVCRDFFLKCIQITSTRVFGALNSFETNPSATEKRGIAASANKTSEFHLQAVRNFIDRIPKYESHYGRSQSQRKYLHHSLNMAKLYTEYKGKCDPKKGECVSENMFRHIFNTEYNLSFKRRHTDTCKTCDEFHIGQRSNLVPPERKAESKMLHEAHLDQVEKTRSEFLVDVENSRKSDEQIIVLTFDLQKTLATPLLETSVAFYKRQLWTYNLCIFDETKKQGNMYVWSENVASRGGQEVGSCLLKHLRDNISEKTTKIIMYSDSCGGQNRNIKLTLLLKKFLHDLTPDYSLESIDQKYLVSGHSYNACDRCFSYIERHRKKNDEIYTPSDWVDVIKESKASAPKFNVQVMHGQDFVSSAGLESMIVNRKKTLDGAKINWFHIRSLNYRKDEPFNLNIICMDGTLQVVNIQKKNFGAENLTNCDLPSLYPDGNAISEEKYKDLMDLMKYVPLEHHEFFINLKKKNTKEDYGLASDFSDD